MGNSNKTVFAYNGMNERISDAETSGGTTTTTYDRWCGSRICQSWNASALIKRYLDEGELNVSSGQKLIDMPDQLGSVRDVLDGATGSLVSAIDYAPFGGTIRATNATAIEYQYAGLIEHAPSALNFSATRALDSTPGRWISRDPIREKGGINLYAYAHDSPINFDDPGGLCPNCAPQPNRGTMDCGWYQAQCAAANGKSTYYCKLAPLVCGNAGCAPWTTCVRLCLQTSDAAYCNHINQGSDTPCIVAIHEKCFIQCAFSP